jgi:hypothetical protein
VQVFVTSTPEELEPHQAAAVDAVAALGHRPVLRDASASPGLDPVSACRRQVARADAVVAIVGWRRGRVPPPSLGGDGLRPWTYWEVAGAFDHRVPVLPLLAGERFLPELREEQPEARAVMADFRGELGSPTSSTTNQVSAAWSTAGCVPRSMAPARRARPSRVSSSGITRRQHCPPSPTRCSCPTPILTSWPGETRTSPSCAGCLAGL